MLCVLCTTANIEKIKIQNCGWKMRTCELSAHGVLSCTCHVSTVIETVTCLCKLHTLKNVL